MTVSDNLRRLSTARIHEVLEYVAPGEIRVLEAEGSDTQLLAHIGFRSASYTRIPVEYLSLAEVVVVLAQAAQLFVELHLEARAPSLLASLAIARLEHRVYFGRFAVSFIKKHPPKDYTINLSLSRVLSLRGTWYGHISFSVPGFVTGQFMGVVEGLGRSQ